LLVTYVPGRQADRLRPGSAAEERAHRGAGETLRPLHAVFLEQSAVDVAAFLSERMLHWAARAYAAALIDQAELRTLHRRAEDLAATTMDSVVCHLDYQPRNWIVQPDGGIAVIDFEHTRLDALARDLARLAFRYWPHRPRLRDEFLTGYGRDLSDEEEHLLSRFAAVEALTSMVRGDERGDPRLFAYGKALLTAVR
jgi:Ser/Thr protein kinase RdoA (MazF antagonist)